MRILSVILLVAAATVSAVEKPAAYVAPMSHLDLTFMGTHDECLSRGSKVLSGALDLLEKQPDFRFLIEYVLFLEAYRAAHPEQAAKLDRHIRAGRVELGAEWSGIYVIQEDEEDLIRNILYAKAYARQRFGIELETLQLTDIPGVVPQLPQVCNGLGIRNLVLTRCAPPDALFWYESPGGARVLTWSSKGYNQAHRYGMDIDVAAMRKQGLTERLAESAKTGYPPLLYYGSDQWLPPTNLVRAVHAWNAGAVPQRRLSITTPTGYFRAIRASGIADKAPVLRGELPSTWPYLEPAHAHVSRWDAPATRALDAAERLSTLAWLHVGRPYPRTELDALWKSLLLARDHNYGGQGAGGGQARKFAERRNVEHRARRLTSQAMAVIAERVKAPRQSVPIVVFNTLNWRRTDIVRAHVTRYPEHVIPPSSGMVFRGPDGQPVPFQITADRRGTLGEFDFVFVARDVPALGYASYTLEPSNEPVTPRGPQLWFEAGSPEPATVDKPEVTLENGKVRLTIERATGLAKINEVATGLGLVGRQELPEVCRHPPLGLSLDDPAREKIEPFVPDAMRLLADGPVLKTVAVCGSVLGAPAEVRYTLCRDLAWVDVEVRMDWDLRQFGRIELVYQVPLKNAPAAYGLPFGAGAFGPEQPVPGSGPRGGDEAPRSSWERTREISRWLDVGGVAMATSHRWTRVDETAKGVAVRCCLVRGGRMRPADPGVNGTELREGLVFNFRFYPHSNSWQAAHIPRIGWETTTPLLAYTVNDTWSPKSLPRQQSLATAEVESGQADALLTCLKQSEDGRDVVMRWFEGAGAEGVVRVGLGSVPFRAQRVDLEERPLAENRVQDTVSTRPWEIVTVRLKKTR